VTTIELVRRISTTEKIFLTNRTVAHILAGLAIVIVKEKCINTHTTVVTVPKVIAASDTAESAIFTMIRRFASAHPQVANTTVIFSKLYATLTAIVAKKKAKK
jgi:hypothetical protein